MKPCSLTLELLINSLTDAQIAILRQSPYDAEVAWSGSKRLIAEFLVRKGLLERHPDAQPPCYRVTELGERVVHVIERHLAPEDRRRKDHIPKVKRKRPEP